MKKQVLLLAFMVVGILLVSMKSGIENPQDAMCRRIVKKFILELNSEGSDNFDHSNIYVSEKPVIIADENLKQLLPDVRFYYTVIFNGAHYEYNGGQIQVIAAVNVKDTNEVQLLAPLDYYENKGAFMNLFLDKKVLNKNETANEIAGLILKTKAVNPFCCEGKTKNISFENKQSADTLINTISYTNYCCDNFMKDEKSKMKDYTIHRVTKFVFSDEKMVKIDYAGWIR